jgi:hypothetical protein
MAVQYAFGKIVTQGLDLNVDAADPTSYPGTGTSWTSVVNRSITGSLVSCSYSTDFKGGIVFNNPSASVVFPGTVANYGTGSFTVEMAFRPTQIEGIHYLVSKNSGSYPNWGVYLSGSGGSGKLFAEYRINASVSCSVSSSTTFVTGSNYFVDAIFSPLERRVYISVDGEYNVISTVGNGTGSLTTTGSLFLGNTAPSSSHAYLGSILNTKVYSTLNSGFVNYRTLAQRIQKVPSTNSRQALALVIGGGGSGGGQLGISGGGGAGGFVYTFFTLNPGTYTINVGAGGNQVTSGNGNNGQSSSLADIIAYGGGAGGGYVNYPGFDGASGGGGGASNTGTVILAGSAIYGSQGNNGGTGGIGTIAGGGGGAGAPGQSSVGLSKGGDGGAGLASSISGVVTYYAGGGGGSGFGGIGGTGGVGGGVNGSGGNPPPATPNTGGGGGGGGYNTSIKGGAGGSGIVIIRYTGLPIATGGTITSVGGDTIHTFTATGSHTFTVF